MVQRWKSLWARSGTEKIPNICSCAPLQDKKGIFHSIFSGATAAELVFDQAAEMKNTF